MKDSKKPKVYIAVYIQNEDLFKVKIGRSVNVHKRVRSFQVPLDLDRVWWHSFDTVSESAYYETLFHKLLNKYHYKREWFMVNQDQFKDLVTIVDAICDFTYKLKPHLNCDFVKIKDY